MSKKKEISDLPVNWKEIILKKSAEGMHKTEVFKELGITYAMHVRFMEESDEYEETFDLGRQFCEAWWDKKGRDNVGNKSFNHILYMFIMKSVFKRQDNHGVASPPQGDDFANEEEKKRMLAKYKTPDGESKSLQ